MFNEIKEKLNTRPVKAIGVTHEFAILILMTEISGSPCFIFEKRAKGINQPGDYCFPGGFIESGETVSEAALRETKEETGIAEDKINVLGRFDSLYNGKRAIHSVVGYVSEQDLANAVIDEKEVAMLVTIPVSHFSDENRREFSLPKPLDTTAFPYEKYGIDPNYKWYTPDSTVYVYEPYGEHVIWGMTAKFIVEFLKENNVGQFKKKQN